MTPAAVLESGTTATTAERTPAPADARRRRRHRLLEAMTALEQFPALTYSRDRLLAVLAALPVSAHDTVRAVESDPALSLRAMGLANRGRAKDAPELHGIPDAVAALTPAALRTLAREVPAFDFFGSGGAWSTAAQHFRIHSAATLCVVERLVHDGFAEAPDVLRLAAVLHDFGKLVVLHAYGRYTTGSEAPALDRLLVERRALGLDHAVVGGVIARRMGLPNEVASLIERHHVDGGGDAAVLRLADLLVHYSAGHPVDRGELISVAGRSGIEGAHLDSLLYELPAAPAEVRRIEPSPLTPRQTEIVQRLAQGITHKEIAAQLGLSASTVRSHLFAAYTRLGVSNGTQAVVLAMKRGWVP
ncbi:MAG: hypothetical protein QOE06_150 [Thermoleophilaceae bacterium]|nr:hypothetical protein [Thermoleophilaceae bacterium]